MNSSMMIMLIQDHNHRSNLTIKEHHEVGGQGSWPRGSRAKTPKKAPPKFPPPCAKFGDFWDPPRTPPFLRFWPGAP